MNVENSSRGTHIPRKTQEFLREELLGDSQESQEKDSAWSSPDGPDEALMRTEGNGYPAAWVGKNDETITVVCRGKVYKNGEARWDLSLREPVYEDGDKALVGISGNNSGYGGDIVFRADLDGELLSAARIVDRQKAVDGEERGIEMLSKGKGWRLFKRFLDEHPVVTRVFNKNVPEYGSSTFVSDGSPEQPVPVFVRAESNAPAAWTGGGAVRNKTKGVLVCTDELGLRTPLETRETSYVSFRQALVQVDQNDLIFRVDGRLPLERENLSLNIEAAQVEDPWAATSPDGDGTVQVEGRKARRLFFCLLDDHPEVKHALQRAYGNDGSAFAGNEDVNPRRLEGTVQWFDEDKGYGFIELDGDGEDIFVHASDVKDNVPLAETDRVKFTLVSSEEGPSAKDVETIETSREAGIVKWFDEEKRYGFIKSEDFVNDLFVHASDMAVDSLSEGDNVEFTPRKSEKHGQCPKAVKVELSD